MDLDLDCGLASLVFGVGVLFEVAHPRSRSRPTLLTSSKQRHVHLLVFMPIWVVGVGCGLWRVVSCMVAWS
jgi:hypothetical protein